MTTPAAGHPAVSAGSHLNADAAFALLQAEHYDVSIGTGECEILTNHSADAGGG